MKLKNINYFLFLLLAACQTARHDSSDSVSALLFERIQFVEDEACLSLNEPLDARSAVFVALTQNSKVRYKMAEISLAEANLEEASTIENPAFSFFYGFPCGHNGNNSFNVSLIQSVISICLRHSRVATAEAGLESVKWQTAHDILGTAFDAEALFYQLKAQEVLSSLLKEKVDLLAKRQEIETERFQEGGADPSEFLESKKEYLQAQDEWLLGKAMEAEAREAFEVVLGISCGYRLCEELPFPESMECPIGLEETVLSTRADVQALRWELKSVIHSACPLGFWGHSALALGAEFEKDADGDKTFGPVIEGEIPLFDWGQAERLQWKALYQQKREELYGLEQAILAELKSHQELLKVHRMRAELYQQELLPLQTKLLQNSEESYNTRTIDQKEYLETQMEMLELKQNSIEAIRDYWQAKIALKRSILQ